MQENNMLTDDITLDFLTMQLGDRDDLIDRLKICCEKLKDIDTETCDKATAELEAIDTDGDGEHIIPIIEKMIVVMESYAK